MSVGERRVSQLHLHETIYALERPWNQAKAELESHPCPALSLFLSCYHHYLLGFSWKHFIDRFLASESWSQGLILGT